ncbi:MAG: hypothetical protein SFY96_02115 [Planctomycetota bacterium]|nr:hypothetical protein [Planctomycetota bacterium]
MSDQPKPTAEPGASADKPTYELEPIAPPPQASEADANRAAKINAPPLAADIDDSVDLEAPPSPSPSASAAAEGDASSAPVGFVTPGRGDARTIAMIAGVVALAAAIAAATTSNGAWYWSLIQAVYQIILHTATGVCGVAIAAILAERPLGDVVLATARMSLSVAALRFCVALNLPLTTTKFEEVVLGVGAYLLVTLILFRRPPVELFFLWCVHAGLWFITFIGAAIDVQAAASLPVK